MNPSLFKSLLHSSRGSTFRILHPSATRLLAYAQTKVKLGGKGEAVTYSIQT